MVLSATIRLVAIAKITVDGELYSSCPAAVLVDRQHGRIGCSLMLIFTS